MQNNQRLILWASFALICFLIYTNWVNEHAPPAPVTPVEQTVTKSEGGIPQMATDSSVPVSNLPMVPTDQIISVKTDVLDIRIKAVGGDIFSVKLPSFPESLEHQDVPFTLMDTTADKLYTSLTGLTGTTNFTHIDTAFTSPQTEYVLADGIDTLSVPLTYTDPQTGITVSKTYHFTRGKFDIGFTHALTNNSGTNWTGREYLQLIQKEPVVKKRWGGTSSYTGPVISMPEASAEYKKIPFGNLKQGGEPMRFEGEGGWISMIQQYFVTAWIPEEAAQHVIEAAKLSNGNTMVRIIGKNNITVVPGQTHEFHGKFFAGPKNKDALNATAKNLGLTLDYGWFSPISGLMFKLLNFYHNFLGNWGWSIVCLTLTVKILLFYFSDKAYRSMARMRLVAPQMERLKEQYGEDRQKLSQEMMALYRREKINPMGGCWPMLIQIPIFIALFWMLQESVELRQAPWILWIKDLSLMDPYFVMPIIMGATMFVQQMFNPTPPDPMQAKIMKWMPVMFTFMFMWFPAGIVLYWIMNNSLTILQQWIINKRIEGAAKTKS